MKQASKIGFTLAEILIVVGIIGIIAESTIPSLIADFQKKVYVTSLQKAYSTVQQGMKGIMAKQGVTSLCDTNLFDGSNFNTAGRQSNIDSAIRDNFNVDHSCLAGDVTCMMSGYVYLGKSGTFSTFSSAFYNFCTADGMCYSLNLPTLCSPDYTKSSAFKGGTGSIYVDINGAKKPNQYGRDYFVFVIGDNGTLFPSYGKAYAEFYAGTNYDTTSYYWQGSTAPVPCGTLGSNTIGTTVSGNSCAARIMEEGWQMNY